MSDTASEVPGRREQSLGGFVAALLVLLVAVGTFVGLRDVNRVAPAGPLRAVDYEQPARFAQESARFEILTPPELPTGWIATSVRFDDGDQQSWHVRLLTGEQRYVGLEQAERSVQAMVEDHVDVEAREGDSVEVGGTTWTRWSDPQRDPSADPSTAPEGDLALVREQGGATTLVVGTVSQDTLTEFVQTLR